MSRRIIINIGSVFGRLTVKKNDIKKINSKNEVQHYVLAECECGVFKEILARSLRKGSTKSCGCLQRDWAHSNQSATRHGMTNTSIWSIWSSMKMRCENPKSESYCRYGGRGIKVCERWHKFENFLADMGDRPPNMTLDRINNDGNYEPSNCRWADKKTQAINRRSTNFVILNNKSLSISDAARILNISCATIQQHSYRNHCSFQESTNFFSNNYKNPKHVKYNLSGHILPMGVILERLGIRNNKIHRTAKRLGLTTQQAIDYYASKLSSEGTLFSIDL